MSNEALIVFSLISVFCCASNLGVNFWATFASCMVFFVCSFSDSFALCANNSFSLVACAINLASNCFAFSNDFSAFLTWLSAVCFKFKACSKDGDNCFNSLVISSSLFKSALCKIPLIWFLCSSTFLVISEAFTFSASSIFLYTDV